VTLDEAWEIYRQRRVVEENSAADAGRPPNYSEIMKGDPQAREAHDMIYHSRQQAIAALTEINEVARLAAEQLNPTEPAKDNS
jgi:hypothetical protein